MNFTDVWKINIIFLAVLLFLMYSRWYQNKSKHFDKPKEHKYCRRLLSGKYFLETLFILLYMLKNGVCSEAFWCLYLVPYLIDVLISRGLSWIFMFRFIEVFFWIFMFTFIDIFLGSLCSHLLRVFLDLFRRVCFIICELHNL